MQIPTTTKQQYITAKTRSKIYIIPMHSVRSIVFEDSLKTITINYIQTNSKLVICDDNVKRIFYDTVKDIRSCDNIITEYNVQSVHEEI